MITPNKIEIEGEEITDEDIAIDIKETKLNLQRALLKVGLEKEAQELENPIQKPEKPISEERKKLLSEIPF